MVDCLTNLLIFMNYILQYILVTSTSILEFIPNFMNDVIMSRVIYFYMFDVHI